MSEPTEQDRKTALDTWLANDHVEAIAQALADEREKARADTETQEALRRVEVVTAQLEQVADPQGSPAARAYAVSAAQVRAALGGSQ